MRRIVSTLVLSALAACPGPNSTEPDGGWATSSVTAPEGAATTLLLREDVGVSYIYPYTPAPMDCEVESADHSLYEEGLAANNGGTGVEHILEGLEFPHANITVKETGRSFFDECTDENGWGRHHSVELELGVAVPVDVNFDGNPDVELFLTQVGSGTNGRTLIISVYAL